MKAIATVNTSLPSLGDPIDYLSGASLRDFDIVLFDLAFPYMHRMEFSGGGSALSIDSNQELATAMQHWKRELADALQSGKTVFVLLADAQDDKGAVSYKVGTGGRRTYETAPVNNYSVLPISMKVKNGKGRQITVKDKTYRGLLDALGEAVGYRVVVETKTGSVIYSTKDGSAVGVVEKAEGMPGHLVFLPYFNLGEFDKGTTQWTKKTMQMSAAVVTQLVAVDKLLTIGAMETPPPSWIQSVPMPAELEVIDAAIAETERLVAELQEKKDTHLLEKQRLQAHTHLLYENGKPLEAAIETALSLLGFSVENYRSGDVEIDHVIIGPSGVRMIGESEGKDTSAVDITKFRQLEGNINEDFQREDVTEPAKGVLFANGYRYTEPNAREEQFTQKCLTNAKRLGTALVRTSDLYRALVYVLDHPEDEAFKEACREAVEGTVGDIVVFPELPA